MGCCRFELKSMAGHIRHSYIFLDFRGLGLAKDL